MLHHRSVVAGALFASFLFTTGLIILVLLMPGMMTLQGVRQQSELDFLPARPSADTSTLPVVIAMESGPILRPNVCPYVGTSAFDTVYDTAKWSGTPAQTASDFYSNATWPPKERKSGSGPGSNLGYSTQVSMQILQHVIREHKVTTMIDLPCGDVNWIFDSLETDSLELYIGLDIVGSVIKTNAARLAHHSNKIFRHWDGAQCPLPKIAFRKRDGQNIERSVDLVHSRDVLQHLTLVQGMQFLCNVFQSGARLFVTTSFPGHGMKNRDIKEGEFFYNDLTVDPYNMPKTTCTPTHPRHEPDLTCVYNLTQPWVADWIAEKKCDEMRVKQVSPVRKA
jgi:hypothetical protein